MFEIITTVSKGEYIYCRTMPKHPNATSTGYVLKHRVMMENSIGRLLTSDEVVHHINENKKDNRIENLQLMTRSEHAAHHSTGQELFEFECAWCHSKIYRDKRQLHKKQKRFFCNHSHRAKFYA